MFVSSTPQVRMTAQSRAPATSRVVPATGCLCGQTSWPWVGGGRSGGHSDTACPGGSRGQWPTWPLGGQGRTWAQRPLAATRRNKRSTLMLVTLVTLMLVIDGRETANGQWMEKLCEKKWLGTDLCWVNFPADLWFNSVVCGDRW